MRKCKYMIHGRQKKKNLIIKLVLLLLIIFVVSFFLRQYVKIKNKKLEIQKIENQILIEESKNKEILGILNEENSEAENNDSETISGRTRVFESVIK